MSTLFKVRNWLRSEIASTPAVTNLLPREANSVLAVPPEDPSETGVYVRERTQARLEQFADLCQFEIYVFAKDGRPECEAIVAALIAALKTEAGMPGWSNWASPPQSFATQIKSVTVTGAEAAERVGIGGGWESVVRLDIRAVS